MRTEGAQHVVNVILKRQIRYCILTCSNLANQIFNASLLPKIIFPDLLRGNVNNKMRNFFIYILKVCVKTGFIQWSNSLLSIFTRKKKIVCIYIFIKTVSPIGEIFIRKTKESTSSREWNASFSSDLIHWRFFFLPSMLFYLTMHCNALNIFHCRAKKVNWAVNHFSLTVETVWMTWIESWGWFRLRKLVWL